MHVSDEYLSFVLEHFSTWGLVSARKMFGGAGLYRDGVMFALIANDDVYLKVNEANLGDFVKASSRQFKPFEHKKATMPYYQIPDELLENTEELALWLDKAFKAALEKKKK
jgi:DNA transformation protein and related proteins